MSRLDDFPALDGLRAVGSIAVLLTHVAFQTGQYPQGVTGALLGRLDVGVALFFVLSGFLLSLGFLRPLAEGRPAPSTFGYVIKRLFRIWPVFAVSVVLATALIGRDTSAASWFHSLTLTHLYSERFFTDGLTQMWSLETEVAFYAFLPMLMALFGITVRRRGWAKRPLLVSLAVLAAMNWVWLGVVAAWIEPDRPFVYQWLPAYLSWFAIGMAISVIWVDATRRGNHDLAAADGTAQWLSRVSASSGALCAMALSVLLIASTPLAGPLTLTAATQSNAIVKNVLYAVVATLIVVPALFGPATGRYRRALSWPPVRYLGHLSYAIFCIHLVVLWYVQEMFGNEVFTGNFLTVGAVTLVLSILVSVPLHHLIERPAIRLSRRLLSGTKTAAKDPVSPTSARS